MELERLGLLALAAMAAGVINSVAGGGSIISFPAAIAAGLPAVTASATNTLALAPGSLASAYALRRELGESRALLIWLLVPAALGSLAGAIALIAAPARVFELLVPWLVLGATLLLVLRDAIQRRAVEAHGRPSVARRLAVALLLGALSVYGGYFGAGMGILTLAVLALLQKLDIHQLNAIKNIVVGSINSVAAAYFVLSGKADLIAALAMALGAVTGGYFAADIARRVRPRIVSFVVAGIGVLLSAILALRYWNP